MSKFPICKKSMLLRLLESVWFSKHVTANKKCQPKKNIEDMILDTQIMLPYCSFIKISRGM